MIGSDISVRVVEVRGDVVRIGVDAPRAVQVHREEVFEAVRAQNLAAAGAPTGSLDALRAGLAGRLASGPSRPVAPDQDAAGAVADAGSGRAVRAPAAPLSGDSTRPKPGPPPARTV